MVTLILIAQIVYSIACVVFIIFAIGYTIILYMNIMDTCESIKRIDENFNTLCSKGGEVKVQISKEVE